MAKTKTARKAATLRVVPLDKNDPRVRAVAAEILDDAFATLKARNAERAKKTAEDQAKHKAVREAAEKKGAKKRKSIKAIVSRLSRIAEPLRAIHGTAELGFGGDDTETALIVASQLSMVCLKRLDDCLVDLGHYRMGDADAWLAGEAY